MQFTHTHKEYSRNVNEQKNVPILRLFKINNINTIDRNRLEIEGKISNVVNGIVEYVKTEQRFQFMHNYKYESLLNCPPVARDVRA